MISWLLEAVGSAVGAENDSRPSWAEVSLIIYELPGSSSLHSLTEGAGLGGAYHVGVAVYWLEWSFGWCAEGSGVYMVHIGKNSLGTFKEKVPLGRTSHTPGAVVAILQELRDSWPGTSYDLLQRNCAHFSVDLVRRLDVESPPGWLDSLSSVGDCLVQRLGPKAAEKAAAAAMPPPERRLAPAFADFGGGKRLAGASEVARREHAWLLAQEYIKERAGAMEAAGWEQQGGTGGRPRPEKTRRGRQVPQAPAEVATRPARRGAPRSLSQPGPMVLMSGGASALVLLPEAGARQSAATRRARTPPPMLRAATPPPRWTPRTSIVY